ncbi:BPSS1780 family membrane protein [Aliiglaciecola sp. 3_MG-2023]|uniref:BPSS1780 family membrane protein n=1 Tax=Aliiglaciecola sp. 3_MG-2023 TaxID=3062644 RepID=UPI0026E3E75B|nr:BPSS1780 family membrane protein [Aliiglaciecola sp. 3_MG-2023]MDO6695236.1 BPSS1780 family membrane protein [Aliiglaciecola sp. 3_MG-2023]
MDNNENSPYQAPESDLTSTEAPSGEWVYTGPSNKAVGDGMTWISEGFSLFKQDIGMWIVTMIVGFIVAIVINIIPFVGSLISMFLTYIWVGGLMLGCQAAAEGKPFDIKYLFAGFSYRAGRLVGLSAIGAVISIVVMFVAMGSVYMDILAGESNPEMMGTQFWLSFLVAMALMLPMVMAVWFAPALIVLQDMPVFAAMKASFIGCFKNVMPFLVYGIVMLVLYILGAIPLALGLLVVIPLLFTSMYVSYRSIYLSKAV